ncbi:transient receptor potential cation channel subfamily V member 1-like [Lampris incognitus]|uniref:transient receptor potential cation channel subfamily V member 1-like n=1 Tax=Lampris incognitus TaxID=2546036 RepID=UPI0024B54913|nr:transient receptor potential cation channel subfamily V member 1-like [Lampris incognitus]
MRRLRGTKSMPSKWRMECDPRQPEERDRDRLARKKARRDSLLSTMTCGLLRGQKAPMDSNNQEKIGLVKKQCRFKQSYARELLGTESPNDEQLREKFSIKVLFEAVASGDIRKLEGLETYLCQNNLRLSDSLYQSNGKTALMKALLNMREEKTDMVEYLLDISDRMGDIVDLVNVPYTDCLYQGQTALHIAIERRSIDCVKKLVEKGANVDAKACGKFFQLHNDNLIQPSFYFGELPLSLAACTNQPEIVDFLLTNNHKQAEVTEKDSKGNTVLHALVVVADNTKENTEFITVMYDHILTVTVRLDHTLKLEDEQNKEGLTPLKLAAKTGKIGLFEHILCREFSDMETTHLSRKFTEWRYGPVHSSLYDLKSLDTYDDPMSVLEMVVYNSDIPNRPEMLQVEPLCGLLDAKWNQFVWRIFLVHFIVYSIYLATFTAIAHSNKDDTPPFPIEHTSAGYLVVLGQFFTLLASCYFFFCGIWDLLRKRPKLHTLLIDGYYDLLFCMQGFLFLVSAGLYISGCPEYLGFLVLSLALSWINLLYFSRGLKHMGVYSVMIQKVLVGDILPFLFVYVVFLFGFAAAIVTQLTEPSPSEDEGHKNANSTYMADTILELFKFTIGMGDLQFTERYKYKLVYYLLLILYIVLTYILLFNMLIALMSSTVENTAQESASIWNLQRGVTTLDIEQRLPLCLRTRLRSGEEKELDTKHGKQEKHWCLRVEEIKWKEWNCNLKIIREEPGSTERPLQPPSLVSTPTDAGKNWQGLLGKVGRRRPKQLVKQRRIEIV